MSPKAGRRGIKFAHPPSELPVGHLPGNEEVGAYFYYILNANPKMATSEICHVIESDLIKARILITEVSLKFLNQL